MSRIGKSIETARLVARAEQLAGEKGMTTNRYGFSLGG